MPLAVTTSFLGLCLIVAFQSFRGIPDPHLGHWILFLYYVATKIRYYQGGYQFSRTYPDVIRHGAQVHRVVILHLGIGVSFLFLICASLIAEPDKFFAFYAATLGTNLLLLSIQRGLIDPTHEGAGQVRKILQRWQLLNSIETPLTLLLALSHYALSRSSVPLSGPQEAVLTGLGAGILLAIHVLDTFWNRDFLFPEKTSS